MARKIKSPVVEPEDVDNDAQEPEEEAPDSRKEEKAPRKPTFCGKCAHSWDGLEYRECPFCHKKALAVKSPEFAEVNQKRKEEPSTQVSSGTRGKTFKAEAEEVGETVTVTWGEELFTPRQFFSYRVGPFTATTKVREGESRAEAIGRVMRELDAVADPIRKQKGEAYIASVKDLLEGIKGEK